ncbi:MAG: restriction endonuclease, SacI family, partial [Candidatus Zixiibacteriota bacterium]
MLEKHWQAVTTEASAKPGIHYITDPVLRQAIYSSVNHKQVAYRFCLPIQLLGKLTNPKLDCLRLQKRKGDPADVKGWDARSLGSKVIGPFNQKQENVLGT